MFITLSPGCLSFLGMCFFIAMPFITGLQKKRGEGLIPFVSLKSFIKKITDLLTSTINAKY